jgi:hypothetical protein
MDLGSDRCRNQVLCLAYHHHHVALEMRLGHCITILEISTSSFTCIENTELEMYLDIFSFTTFLTSIYSRRHAITGIDGYSISTLYFFDYLF